MYFKMAIVLVLFRGRSRVFGKGKLTRGSKMHSQHVKHAGSESMPSPLPENLKIDAKILQFRGISTHYTT